MAINISPCDRLHASNEAESRLPKICYCVSSWRRIGAFLSQAEYKYYLQLKGRETKVFKIDELPDDLVRDIERAEYGVVDK